ncbi:MAG: hypothetical protein ACTSUS_04580 [Candidatus Freyarchaeota archaeon]
MAETLPGCIGYCGSPLPPNGPCKRCKYAELCKRMVPSEKGPSLRSLRR